VFELIAGGVCVFVASFLGGVSGFGYSLVATPLLLLLGFPLPFVVTVNLALAFVTRISVVYRFRRFISRRRVAGMIGGSVPGLWLGAQVLITVSQSAIKLAAGLIVMVMAVILARDKSAEPPKPIPGAPVVAGFTGGFLGSATSLNGIGPILLLARDKASARSFLADLALYFVASNAIGLLILFSEDALSERALYPTFLLWLPASLVGNWIGTAQGPKLPAATFRRLTLVLMFVAGALTAGSAI
jgi:uncharacterized membrane protein YfcA